MVNTKYVLIIKLVRLQNGKEKLRHYMRTGRMAA